jgi:hypothetical protein
MAFFTKKSSTQGAAVYDIADDSVAVALVTTGKKLPEIIWSRRYPIFINRDHGKINYTQALRRALDVLQRDVVKIGLPLCKRFGIQVDSLQVKCVMSSGWHTADTVTSRIQRDELFIPDNRHLETAQQSAHKDFMSRYQHEFEDDEPVHLTHRMLGILGDEQPISMARKKPVEKFDVHMYISKTPQSVKRVVDAAIEQIFHTNNIRYYSGFETTNQTLMSADRSLRDFTVVAPGRRKTDIVYTSNGVIRGIASSSLGEDFMVRTIARALNRPHHDVRSRIQLQQRGKHHQSSVHEIDIALKEISKRWSSSVHEKMKKAGGGALPEKVYILLPASKTSAVFSEFAKEINTHAPDLSVFLINQERLSDYVQSYGTSDHALLLSELGSCGY